MEFAPDFTLPDSWVDSISSSKLLLLQREIPEHVSLQAARFAASKGVKIVLDLGGRDDAISPELISLCDIVSPNEVS